MACFEVMCEGLKPTDRFLHLRRYYVRFLHCRQISAAIICKFESNKQTKHNLFLAHSQISLLHRFPRLHFPQSAISFPGKIKQNWKERETIPCNGRIWNFYCLCMHGTSVLVLAKRQRQLSSGYVTSFVSFI